ncbi:hypothetical protein V1525DRAFT_398762 [Lipomyces kononenkoae]|uniref:Uncharacterized protein n=1 Tax=Lipomyces kononenkoae TaxID=34357 RepID=A0ACC3T5F3_LIPKO
MVLIIVHSLNCCMTHVYNVVCSFVTKLKATRIVRRLPSTATIFTNGILNLFVLYVASRIITWPYSRAFRTSSGLQKNKASRVLSVVDFMRCM